MGIINEMKDKIKSTVHKIEDSMEQSRVNKKLRRKNLIAKLKTQSEDAKEEIEDYKTIEGYKQDLKELDEMKKKNSALNPIMNTLSRIGNATRMKKGKETFGFIEPESSFSKKEKPNITIKELNIQMPKLNAEKPREAKWRGL